MRIRNKPLLHKKGKQWIVIGLSALMLAGFGGAVGLSQSTVHADTNTVQTSINKNLAQNNNKQSSANSNNGSKATGNSSSITNQATNMHAKLFANAALAPVTGTNDSASNGQKSNQANANQKEEVVSEPEVGNASGTYEGMNYTSDGNGTVTFTGALTGAGTAWGNPSDFFNTGHGGATLPSNAITQAKKLVFGTHNYPVDFGHMGQETIADMFTGAHNNNIQEIDFNNVTGMNKVTSMKQMFGSDGTNPNLKTIYLGKGFDMSEVTSDTNMFGTYQPVDTNHRIMVSSLNTYGNLKPNVMSQVKMPNIPNKKTGKYDGLNYIYDPNTSTVMFTSGDLSWNKGVGTSGNYGNQDFIGSGDEKPSESYGQDAPTFMNTAKHIIFRNIDLSKDILNDAGGQSGNARYMFADNPNVESIDLGPDFVNRKLETQGGASGYTITNIFQSDTNLKSITIPNGFINGEDNAAGAFTNDNNLKQINILPSPNSIPSSNRINGQTKFASNDGLTGNWRQGGTSQYNPIINTPLSPGSYAKQGSNASTFDFVNDSFQVVSSTGHPIRVNYDTTNDTITFTGGTLPDNSDDSRTTNKASSLALPTRIKDISTGQMVPSDLLPNNKSDWTIRFNNVTAPNSLYFYLDGKNEYKSTAGTNSSTTPAQRNAQEKRSRNFIGNQVSDIDLSGLNTGNTTDMEGLMINDYHLKHVNFGNGSKFNTSKVTNMAMMLGSDSDLTNVDLSRLKGNNLNEAWDILYNDKHLQGVKLSAQFSPHYKNNEPVNNPNAPVSDAINIGEMFGSDPSLQFKNINWNGFDTSKVTAFYGMFRNDKNLGNVTLPVTFNTNNGINFGKSIPQRTEEKTGIDGMFQSDKGTTSIDLGPNFDTSKASDISGMFQSDKSLKNINLGNNFNTSNVSNMQQMFAFGDPISDLNLPSDFDTRKAYNNNPDSPNNGQARMFESDKSLNTITINSPDTIFNGKDNSSITNGSNNKFSYNAWGYVSDNNGNLSSNPEPKLYRENLRKDADGKPTTLAGRHDFSNGKDGSNNGDVTGTFISQKDTNPGVTNLYPSYTDIIIFTYDKGGKSWVRYSTGQDTTKGNVTKSSSLSPEGIPDGYTLSNSESPYFTYRNDGIYDFNVVPKSLYAPTINYIDADNNSHHGSILGQYIANNGNPDSDLSALSETDRDNINDVKGLTGYSIKSGQNINHIKYDGGTHIVYVTGDTENGSNGDSRNHYNVTVNIQEKDSEGNYITHTGGTSTSPSTITNTEYVSVANNSHVGDSYTLLPSQVEPAGFDITPNDSVLNGEITSTGLSNGNITWTYTKSSNPSTSSGDNPDNDVMGTIILHLNYRGTNGQTTTKNAYRTIEGLKGQNLEININPNDYNEPGYVPESTNPLTVNINQLTHDNWANNIITGTFNYNAKPVNDNDSKPIPNNNYVPHNSTVILPGGTTNNYYYDTTNKYYYENNKHTTHVTRKEIKRVYNPRGLERIGINQPVYYRGYKITRMNIPAHFRWIYITRKCLAYNNLVNFGRHSKYRAVLNPNRRITLRINKLFKVQRGKKTYYDYEIRIGKYNCFVTGNSRYTQNCYYQPRDLRRTKIHGVFRNYYRARLILNNDVYKSRYYTRRTFVRRLRRGKIVHIKRIIFIGRKGDEQTRFQLTNGDYITSNKNWIRLIK